MRTQKEIIDYLGLEEENNNAELIKTALEIEKKFESQLKSGLYGYGLSGDLQVHGRLEDPIYELKEIININDIVVYEKILDSEYISEQASNYHEQDLYHELEFYQYLCSLDKRIEILTTEAVKETCKIHEIDFEAYKTGSYEFEDYEYDEFLLDLVNNIAEWIGIDNHGGN